MQRRYSTADRFLTQCGQILSTLSHQSSSQRPNPAADIPEACLTSHEKHRASRLMRVNHSGEVCAQALYQGQAFTAKASEVRTALMQSAAEEIDHLTWCKQRLTELGSHTSYLNPLWYTGSLAIGALAGICGDAWNLGFLAETEHQVVAHLEKHLQSLPSNDIKSQKILQQMRDDEQQHASTAITFGAKPMPRPIRTMMSASSKVMTTLAYWV